MLEIGAGPFAAVIEEADIVVLLFQRLDFALDEIVDAHEKVGDLLGDREVHGCFLGNGGAPV